MDYQQMLQDRVIEEKVNELAKTKEVLQNAKYGLSEATDRASQRDIAKGEERESDGYNTSYQCRDS